MKPFEESDRYNYPLRHDSVIMDIGCYKGRWAVEMARKFGCTIYAFEPIKEFFDEAVKNLFLHHKAHVFNFGLGAYDHAQEFTVKGEMTGPHADQGRKERVDIRSIAGWLEDQCLNHIDLVSINCEGGEFSILPRLIESGDVKKFGDIMVQFHSVTPTCVQDRDSIRAALEATHHLTYDAPFCWENWQLNK